jgi:hypothetical protein
MRPDEPPPGWEDEALGVTFDDIHNPMIMSKTSPQIHFDAQRESPRRDPSRPSVRRAFPRPSWGAKR